MSHTPHQPDPHAGATGDGQLPETLATQLRKAYRVDVQVPQSVDEAVRAAARRVFSAQADEPQVARKIGVLYRVGGALAAAAVLGLVLILSGVFSAGNKSGPDLAHHAPVGTSHEGDATNTSPIAGDINADGRINIVDAYLLQRRIDRSTTLDKAWDVTGDGQINAQDVQAIAAAAVKIQQVSFPLPSRERVAESSRPGEGESARTSKGLRYQFVSTLTPALSLKGRGSQMFIQADAPIRFTTYDIIIDSKDLPLAVYQIEIKATAGDVQITGIEGGEPDAYKAPPYYDPQAMQQSRVILAAFSTAEADQLPRGKVRVATLHVQITGEAEPKFDVKLEAAGTVEGEPIKATATLQAKRMQL